MSDLTLQTRILEQLYQESKGGNLPKSLPSGEAKGRGNRPSVDSTKRKKRPTKARKSRSFKTKSSPTSTSGSTSGSTSTPASISTPASTPKLSSAQNISKFGKGIKGSAAGQAARSTGKIASALGIKGSLSTVVSSKAIAAWGAAVAPVALTAGAIAIWKNNFKQIANLYRPVRSAGLYFTPRSQRIAREAVYPFRGGQSVGVRYTVTTFQNASADSQYRNHTVDGPVNGIKYKWSGRVTGGDGNPYVAWLGQLDAATASGSSVTRVFYIREGIAPPGHYDVRITNIVRTDGQEDTGGDPLPTTAEQSVTDGTSNAAVRPALPDVLPKITPTTPTSPNRLKPRSNPREDTPNRESTPQPEVEPQPDIPSIQPPPRRPQDNPPQRTNDPIPDPNEKQKPDGNDDSNKKPPSEDSNDENQEEVKTEIDPETGGVTKIFPGAASGSTPPKQTKVSKCKKGCGGSGGGGNSFAPGNPATLNLASLMNDIIVQNPLLKKIDATTVATKTAVLSPTHGLAKIQSFAETAWKTIQGDKIMAGVNTALTIHNAMMLSNNLLQTISEATNMTLNALNIRDETDSPIDIGAAVRSKIDAVLINLLGAEKFAELTARTAKANRIYQSSINVLDTTRAMFDSARSVAELTAENTGKIGNALRESGAVYEDAYNEFAEKVNPQNAAFRNLEAFREGVDNVEDAFSTVSQVSGEVVEIQENWNQLKAEKEAWKAEVNAEIETQVTEKAEEKESVQVTTDINELDFERNEVTEEP